MVRTIGAALAGLVLWSALWLGAGRLIATLAPDTYRPEEPVTALGLLVVFLLLSVLVSLVSGFLAGRIAGQDSRWVGWALGAFLLAVGLVMEIAGWGLAPAWYHVAFLVFLIPAVLAGSRLATRR